MKKRIMSLILTAMMVVMLIPLGLTSEAVAIYEVSFDTQGRGEAPSPVYVIHNHPLSEVITDEDGVNLGSNGGDMFYGWSLKKNPTTGDVYDFSAGVTEDITLYPIWVPAIDKVNSWIDSSDCPVAGKQIPEDVSVYTYDNDIGVYEIYGAYWVLAENGTPATGTFQNGKAYYLCVMYAPVGDRLIKDDDGHFNNSTVAVKESFLNYGSGSKSATYIKGSKYLASSYYLFVLGDVTTHIVSFDANGHGVAPATIEVPHGWTLGQLLGEGLNYIYNTMYEEGWEFQGWYNYVVLGGEFYAETVEILGDLPLTAEWSTTKAVSDVNVTVRVPNIGDSPIDLYNAGTMAAVDPTDNVYFDWMYTYYVRSDGTPFDLSNDKFEAGFSYDLLIALEPDVNHHFAGGRTYYGNKREGKLTITINGESYNYAPMSYNQYRVVAKYSFVPLSSEDPVQSIQFGAFSVIPPIAGESAYASSFAAIPVQDTLVQTDNVQWYIKNDLGDYVSYTGKLEYGVTYKFETEFLAKTGYTFASGVSLNLTSGGLLLSVERLSPALVRVTGTLTPVLPFTDVPGGTWYTDAVGLCFTWGLMTGTSDTTFSPGMDLSRAMFVTILAKLDAAKTVSYTGSSFTDVPEGKWYSKPIEWAYQNNYASGIGGGKFGPSDPVTREQLAQFFYNYCSIKGYETGNLADLSKFTDAGKISGWAKTAMQWAVGNNILSGTSETTISPKNSASRAQVAVIIRAYLLNIIAPIS